MEKSRCTTTMPRHLGNDPHSMASSSDGGALAHRVQRPHLGRKGCSRARASLNTDDPRPPLPPNSVLESRRDHATGAAARFTEVEVPPTLRATRMVVRRPDRLRGRRRKPAINPWTAGTSPSSGSAKSLLWERTDSFGPAHATRFGRKRAEGVLWPYRDVETGCTIEVHLGDR